jgi:spore coat protein U-like protein
MKFSKKSVLTLFAAVVALALTSLPVAASTATTTFAVSATVQATCSVTATALTFGTYSTAQLDNTSTVSVTCTNTTPYTVGLDAGTATGATVTTRKMINGANTLSYTLYNDSGRTTNWGNTAATNWVSGTGNGSAQALTVYGRIPAAQYVNPVTYNDTITVTVTY